MASHARFEVVAAVPAEAAARLPASLGLTTVVDGALAFLMAPAAPAGGGLRALVSNKGARQAIERLVARQKLLEALHAAGEVLPARPGQALRAELVRPALAANATALGAALASVAGLAQYQILVRWSPAGTFARFAGEPELALAADARGRAEGAEALRRRLGREISTRIAARAQDSVLLPLDPGPEMLANVAVLVPRRELAPLEAELEAIDAIWSEGLAIRMIGPGPAVSFAAFELVAPGGDAAAARRTLGLGRDAPETAIRAALRARVAAGEAGASGGALADAAEMLKRLERGKAAVAAAGLTAPGDSLPLVRFLRDGDAPTVLLSPQTDAPAEETAA